MPAGIDCARRASRCSLTRFWNSCCSLLSVFSCFFSRAFSLLFDCSRSDKRPLKACSRRWTVCKTCVHDCPGQSFVVLVVMQGISDFVDIPSGRVIVGCVDGLFEAPGTEVKWQCCAQITCGVSYQHRNRTVALRDSARRTWRLLLSVYRDDCSASRECCQSRCPNVRMHFVHHRFKIVLRNHLRLYLCFYILIFLLPNLVKMCHSKATGCGHKSIAPYKDIYGFTKQRYHKVHNKVVLLSSACE